jgi:glucose/sorbosone dehydrogenase
VSRKDPLAGRIWLSVLLATVCLGLASFATRAEAQSGSLTLRQIGTFTSPVYVDNAPGYSDLLFVVEQRGTIRVRQGGTLLGHFFLDIQGLVRDDGNEEGLLSVAFAPDYASSGRFYVYFTNAAGNNEIDEFRRSAADPTRADPGSRRVVLEIPHPGFNNHNGGQLQFGPDGYLWIATGDGGGAGDPGENAQNLRSLLGKLLRIDPRAIGSRSYSVPADNPFVHVRGRDEIYAYGLRNPWRFSFDRRSGALALGDVGQSSWEEIDFETKTTARGANFGWDNFEGTHLFEGPPLSAHELPIHEYSSASGTGNCSVTGGYVVRDPGLPTLVGRYLYADFCKGELRSFVPRLGGASGDAPIGLAVSQPTSFGEGVGNRIYIASRQGPVYQLLAQP